MIMLVPLGCIASERWSGKQQRQRNGNQFIWKSWTNRDRPCSTLVALVLEPEPKPEPD